MSLTADNVYKAFSPRPVRYYERVDSTNDLALKWLREGAPPGSVVVADEQVKGRGRLGRTWYTPPGTALILSVILRPVVEQLPQITMLGALAICDLLNHLGAQKVAVKWPNDVLLDGLKVSGILPEAVWTGSHIEGVVLGIGINVRIDFSGTELADGAISIESTLGRPVDRLSALAYLLSRLDKWAAQLGTDTLYCAWRARLVTIGHYVSLGDSEHSVSGQAEDVDEMGALLLRDGDGVLHRVLAGDIVMKDRSVL
jgi:BirA family biotin operon repressor/biotin-[acetyl-CoA-carboxylase] ligase